MFRNKIFIILILLVAQVQAQDSALSIADSLYAVGKYSEAIDHLQNIKDKREAVFLKLAKAYEAKGANEEAARNYRLVLEKDTARTLAAFAYGKLLGKLGQLEKADSIVDLLVEKYPKNPAFLYQNGLIKEQRKDSSAILFFHRAARWDPGHQQAHFKVAKNQLQHRKFYEARFMAGRGLNANPDDPSLLSILAQANYHLKYYEEAVDSFQRLVKLGEGNAFIHRSLAVSFTRLEKFEKAIEQYNLALTYDGKNPVYHHNLGKLYTTTGDIKAAKKHLFMSILLQRQPIDAEYFDLAMAYKAGEEFKLALEYLERALEENPEHEKALFERAIVADSFYADLETRKNFYRAYLNKFEENGDKDLILLAQRRIKDIVEEIHMAQ